MPATVLPLLRRLLPALAACLLALPSLASAAAESPFFQNYRQAQQRQDVAGARRVLDDWLATGDPVAVAEQAEALRKGWPDAKDPDRAFALFQQAAQAGNAWAQRMVGWMLQEGEGRPKDAAAALAAFRRAAEAGDGWSVTQVGWYHEKGWGTPVDFAEAVRWYTRAAEASQPIAMNNLGVLYGLGLPGVPVDADKARFWTEKAAQAGNEPARQRLAAAAPPAFKVRPLPGPGPERLQLFNGALRAAAQMGFKADEIDNDSCTAQLRHSYQGRAVGFRLEVPVAGRVRGNIAVADDNIRAGFIQLYQKELARQVGTAVDLDGNISGR